MSGDWRGTLWTLIVTFCIVIIRCTETFWSPWTYLRTPWSTFPLGKLNGSELVKKFPACYGTCRFITAFTSAYHLSLYWGRSIQSMSSHPTSWRSTLIFSSHIRLGLPNGLFPSGYPNRHTQPVWNCTFCKGNKFRLDVSYHLVFLFKNVQ
jgi:hypothetical protein